MPEIPEFYQQLLCGPGPAVLSVTSKDGSIQSVLVWSDFDGQCIKLNMVSGSPKERSIVREAKATLLKAHPGNENLYISVRCQLQRIDSEGAIDHLNTITQRNMGVANWYGDVEPEDAPSKLKRVIIYLKPVRIYHP